MEESEEIYAQAATDGNKQAFLISNISEEVRSIETNLGTNMKAYLINAEKELEPVEINPESFTMQPDDVILFKNYQ
jgi:hypothetical protein